MAGQRLTNVIQLKKSANVSPQVYTAVGNVVDFNGPQFTNDRIDVTDGDSPSNAKEYLPARQDPGPLQVTLNYNFQNVKHQELYSDMQTSPPTVSHYRIEPSSTTGDYLHGLGFVGSLALQGNTRGQALQAAVSIQAASVWLLSHV